MLCPFATHRLLPENNTAPRMVPRAVILHTAVDSATPNSSIFPYFGRADVLTESTFYVMDNGTIEQYMDTERQADANVSANPFAISIETEDDGNPEQTPWKLPQLNSIIKLVHWCCDVHEIPHKQITTPTGSGIGWHSMWGINTATHKPNPWTSAIGKTCPGGPRINQMGIVIQGEVSTMDEKSITDEVMQRQIPEYTTDKPDDTMRFSEAAARARQDAYNALVTASRIEAKVDAIRLGGVDLDQLADKVTDRMLSRLNLKQAP